MLDNQPRPQVCDSTPDHAQPRPRPSIYTKEQGEVAEENVSFVKNMCKLKHVSR